MLKKLSSSSLLLLFFVLPLVFCPLVYDRFELPKILFFIFSLNVTIGLGIRASITESLANIKKNRILKYYLLYLIILTVSTLINPIKQNSVWGQYYRYQGLVTQIHYLLFTLFYFSLAKKGISLKRAGKIIAVSGLTQAFLIIFQGIWLKIFHFPIYNYNGRLAGLLGNPNFAAGFLVLSFPYFWHYSSFKIPRWLTSLIFLLALLLTGSRSGLIAFLATNLFLIIKKISLSKFILAGSGLVLSLLILVSGFRSSPFENRIAIWQKGVQAIAKKPLLGWGLENFETAFQSTLTKKDFNLRNIRVDRAHNLFLEIAINSGLVGFSVYLLIIYQTLKTLWKGKEEIWLKTNLIALISFLILAQFNVLNLNEYLFFYFSLTVAANQTEQ